MPDAEPVPLAGSTAGPARRLLALSWLAGSLLGRPVTVSWGPPGQDSRATANGIEIDPQLDPLEQRCAAAAQALLRRHAGEANGHRPPTLARPALLRRYAALLLAWALDHHRQGIPGPVWRHLRPLLAPAASTPAGPSAAWAAARADSPVAALPRCVGTLDAAAFSEPRLTPADPAAATERTTAADDALDDADHALLERLRSPVRGFGLADVLLSLLGFARGAENTSTHEAAADGASVLADGSARRNTERGLLAAFARQAAEALRGPPRQGLWYPEWDERRQAYRPRHACVADIDPVVDDGRVPPPVPAPLPGWLRRLWRVGVAPKRSRAQPDGHDLDLDACIDHRVRLRAGDPGGHALFVGTRPAQRDLSVLVLVDLSRSTADLGPDGQTQLQVHLRAAEHLVSAFERLGDRVALSGFHSWGPTLVRFVRIKGFDERWADARARLAVIEPSGMTRTGAAVRHAGRHLAEQRGARRRLLLLLTDGHPHDDGYEGAQGLADTRRALAEVAAEGTATLALHVGGAPHDAALSTAYGDGAWLRVDQERDLPSRLPALMAQALARANSARSRRLLQAGHAARRHAGPHALPRAV
ncbi:nitric oxide reductase activation protein NorD [Ideonella sp. B508-1]|uniref:nitric oxide reductase activation protein NorD n=1 Tax=Ideonella sp. B508-1 TaxID=137716 RepID=UPI00034850C4|nr:VWA domain-containing protein [Ideonella sp. B508-1]